MTRTPRKCQLVFGDEPGRIVNPFGQRRRCESARNRVNTDSCRQSSYAHALCPDALWHGKPTDNYHEKHAENRHARVRTVSRFPPCGNRRSTKPREEAGMVHKITITFLAATAALLVEG